jgi:hypothetical protein
MSFEPFRSLSFFDFLINALLWGSIVITFSGIVTLLVSLAFREKEIMKAVLTTMALMGIFALLGSCMVLHLDNVKDNEAISLSNLSKKYDVDSLTYEKDTKQKVNYPDQKEPQNVIIRSQGKSRPAILVQNLQTFEPMLTDFDTGEPLTDLLRKANK